MAEEKQTMAEALQQRVMWHEAEVRTAKKTYEARKKMAIMELEDMVHKLKQNRLYSTDAQNLNAYMVNLEATRRDLEEAEGKLDVVNSLVRVLEEGGE